MLAVTTTTSYHSLMHCASASCSCRLVYHELLFLVVIERDELREELISDSINRSHLVGCDGYINILHLSNYRLEFRVFNSIERLHNNQVIIVRLVLHNSGLYWGKMLLVRKVYMV